MSNLFASKNPHSKWGDPNRTRGKSCENEEQTGKRMLNTSARQKKKMSEFYADTLQKKKGGGEKTDRKILKLIEKKPHQKILPGISPTSLGTEMKSGI